MIGVGFRFHNRGRNWGDVHQGFWSEIVIGPYSANVYWESINGWRRFGFRLKGRALLLGPLTIVVGNWKKRQQHPPKGQDHE